MTTFSQKTEKRGDMNWDLLQSVSAGSSKLSERLSAIVSNSADVNAKLDSANRATGAYTIILQGKLSDESEPATAPPGEAA